MAHIMLLAHTETQLWSCMTSVGAAVSRESHVRHSLAVPLLPKPSCNLQIGYTHVSGYLARTISYNACKQLLIVHLQIETEEDELWGPDFREEKEQIKARGLKFMQWLMTRPEQRIAVVSHSSFLFFTMANFGLHAPALIQVMVSDCKLHASHGRPYRDAPDRLFWREKTCPARTKLIQS